MHDETKKIKNIVLDILKYSDEHEVFENKTRLLIVSQTGQPKVLIKLTSFVQSSWTVPMWL